MKLITDDLIKIVAHDICEARRDRWEFGHTEWYLFEAEETLKIVAPMIVRRCLRHIDAHHDDFIDGHNGKEYFEIVDEILIKVKVALRELVEENG